MPDKTIQRNPDTRKSEPTSLTSIVNKTLSMKAITTQTSAGHASLRTNPLVMSLTQKYPPSQVCRSYSPSLQSMAISAFPTILQAHKAADVPAIVHLAQAYDDDLAVKWVQDQLLAVNKYVGAKSKLTDSQLDELALQIRLEYGYLNLFEFILFCARLRSGKYEDFYGSIDPMRILKSLEQFCQDRWYEIEKDARELEKERSKREEAERLRNAIPFEQWYAGLSEEKKKEVKSTPYGAALVSKMEAKASGKKKDYT